MLTGWKIYQGDGEEREVSFPPPPPWRQLARAADHRGRAYRPTEREVDMVNAALHLRDPCSSRDRRAAASRPWCTPSPWS